MIQRLLCYPYNQGPHEYKERDEGGFLMFSVLVYGMIANTAVSEGEA
jgi:hypothetical protein